MKYYLLVLSCIIVNCIAEPTNNIVIINNNANTIDVVNDHMKENYRLLVKKDKTLTLTGYTIRDESSHLVKTYSVLHLDF